MIVSTQKVLAFATQPDKGNPAGVVLNSPALSNTQMKEISKRLLVSETAFVFPSDKADFRVRFFSPLTEVDLCGHATIAAFYSLGLSMSSHGEDVLVFHQETNAGILPVHLHFKNAKIDRVMMTQQTPIFQPVQMNRWLLATTLGIDKLEINMDFSHHRVSTGLFTMPVCVSSREILKEIKPNYSRIKKLCKMLNVGSLHVFTFDTLETTSLYHARNFAPMYGILEDPVTGTANGAVTSYLFYRGILKKKVAICEQGDIIGRSGRVMVNLLDGVVQVGGKAFVADLINIEV